MKVLFQDASVEGPVRMSDLSTAVEKLKTAMGNKEAWRKTAMKNDQRQVPSSINSKRA